MNSSAKATHVARLVQVEGVLEDAVHGWLFSRSDDVVLAGAEVFNVVGGRCEAVVTVAARVLDVTYRM